MRASSCHLGCVLWALTVLAAPSAAAAAPAQPVEKAPEGEEPELDPALDKARLLHDEGMSAYELADYTVALEKFSAAYVALPGGTDTASIRSAIVFNVGITQMRMYELDGDLVHLRKAKLLLTRYFVEFSEDGASGDEKGRALMVEIEEALAASETQAAAQAEARPQPTPEPPPTPDPATSEVAGPDPDEIRRARLLIGIGAGVLGAAAAAGGLALGGAGWGQNLESGIADGSTTGSARVTALSDGRTANGLAIGSAAAAGVLLVAGGVILGLGLRKKRDAKRAVALAPTGLGLAIGGRF